MNKTVFAIVTLVVIAIVWNNVQSAVLSNISANNRIVVPHNLSDFFDDFNYVTSKDLLSSLTGNQTTYSPTPNDWKTAVYIMYKYKEIALIQLINIYPLLPYNDNKFMIHNAVMNLLEEHKTDERIRMLYDIRKNKIDVRPYMNALVTCNPYLAMFNWLNDTFDTSNTIESDHNYQSDSERSGLPAITNFTDILAAMEQFHESEWTSLLLETSDTSLSMVMDRLVEQFSKNYELIDFEIAVAFIENIPNDSAGNLVKKTLEYGALLETAKTDRELAAGNRMLQHYFDVALSFDGFCDSFTTESEILNNFIKSIKDKYNGCYKSVIHGGSSVFKIKSEKYGEYLYTQSVISQRNFKSKPRDVSENIYTPIFTWRGANRINGFEWEVQRNKNVFWLKNIEFDRYMDSTRCRHIHSITGNNALPQLAIKILPYIENDNDTGSCRIMNANTKQFLYVGDNSRAEDLLRRTIFCGTPDRVSDERAFNWRFEEELIGSH